MYKTSVCTQDCMLNGQCKLTGKSGICACDTPWTGSNCGVLAYATTPASAKSLYNISDPRNTWNGLVFRSTHVSCVCMCAFCLSVSCT